MKITNYAERCVAIDSIQDYTATANKGEHDLYLMKDGSVVYHAPDGELTANPTIYDALGDASIPTSLTRKLMEEVNK